MKSIVITGCSTGFGFDAAKHLAEQGHKVYASMRNTSTKNAEAAKELSDFAKSKNLPLSVVDLDVTSDQSVDEAMKHIEDCDVLINNAGRGFGGPVEAFTSEECMAQLDLNVIGNLRMLKAVLPMMRAKRSGLVIQLSSIAGRLAVPGFGIYHASKWAVEGMSESLRYELGPLGIDVAIVQPGPFSTNFFHGVISPEDTKTAEAYEHVSSFLDIFWNQSLAAFEDSGAPTDPALVVKKFEELINLPAGQRPLRNSVGLDFGAQSMNDVTEPVRLEMLKGFSITEFDGVKA
ncbi:SDR family oxidoreductase [Psychroflexus sediminis]|uniref:NADP-dependent 3-hydroxy acid dehydrogenase YdfG n=1 Tax=Psychroflexus sediminis TaxID=470826 RepID=A0A1G7X0U2_9FLAO|nr:SDR family oxidoreductase [Psychroflexus sediminis]SDG77771.1 NADP-dependent 3-hydroxy acid dehydrogenase YdfG [Psychroflexus sediminis]